MTPDRGAGYVFDTADPAEQRRLDAHAVLWDPFTFRKLAETGVGKGWSCLEIGAGTGSVAAWLVEQVGPSGQVVATDVETRWLAPMATSNLEVRHHNVTADPLEEAGFDLIHARLVLEHLPQRAAVADKLVRALRPGGWLVVEDYDIRPMALSDPHVPAWAAVNETVVDVLRAAGSDPLYGSSLVRLLWDSGLSDVRAEGFVRPMPIPDLAPVFRPALARLGDAILASGRVTVEQLTEALELFEAGEQPAVTYTPVLVCASGRRHTARFGVRERAHNSLRDAKALMQPRDA